ncbi:hypothetical protein TNCV_2474381 [Trichonephila clavipes]|nr:hypothetical protein TNCV_2474381 [Trichonephila clavipes]
MAECTLFFPDIYTFEALLNLSVNNTLEKSETIHLACYTILILPLYKRGYVGKSGPWVAWWLGHWTPDRKAWVRCPMRPNTFRVHKEYMLVKSVGSKVLWTESRVQGTGEYFPPLQTHGKIVEVEIGDRFGPVSGTVVTHVRAFEAWGPRIIDKADTAVVTPLMISYVDV